MNIIYKIYCYFTGHEVYQQYHNFSAISNLIKILLKLEVDLPLITSTDRHKFDKYKCAVCNKMWNHNNPPAESRRSNI